MLLHLANPPAAKLVWELPPSPCHHPHASLPEQEGYHTFPLCQFSCLPNHRQAGCAFTRSLKIKPPKEHHVLLKNPNKSPPNQIISQVRRKAKPRQKLNQLREEAAPASCREGGRGAQGTGGRMETTELHPALRRKGNSTQPGRYFCRQRTTTSILQSLGGNPTGLMHASTSCACSASSKPSSPRACSLTAPEPRRH